MPLDCTALGQLCGFDFSIKRCQCGCFRFCCSSVNIVVADGEVPPELITSFAAAIIDGQVAEPPETRVQKIHTNTDEVERYRDIILSGMRAFGKRCVRDLSPTRARRDEGLERFKLASRICEVDFDEKEKLNQPLLEKEQTKILEQVEIIQKYGSLAAHLWNIYKRLDPDSVDTLERAKQDCLISGQVFKFYKDLRVKNRTFHHIDSFAGLAFADKQQFLETAKKIHDYTTGCFSCCYSIKEVSELGSDFVYWVRQRPSASHQLSFDEAMLRTATRVDFLGARATEQKVREEAYGVGFGGEAAGYRGGLELMPVRVDSRDVRAGRGSLIGAGVDEVELEVGADINYSSLLVEKRAGVDFQRLGLLRLRVIASILDMDITRIKTNSLRMAESERLIAEIRCFNQISPVIYHLFKAFKETQPLRDEAKTRALKETYNIKGKKFATFLTRTSQRRAQFFSAIAEARDLIDLPEEFIRVFYWIALEYELAEIQALREIYSLQDWINGSTKM